MSEGRGFCGAGAGLLADARAGGAGTGADSGSVYGVLGLARQCLSHSELNSHILSS